jgi:hypothetical protein
MRIEQQIGTLTRISDTQVQLTGKSVVKLGGLYQVLNSPSLVTSTTGIGGLDTGSVANNQLYYVYAVAISGNSGIVASLNDQFPTGFNRYKMVGNFRTDNTSNIFNVRESSLNPESAESNNSIKYGVSEIPLLPSQMGSSILRMLSFVASENRKLFTINNYPITNTDTPAHGKGTNAFYGGVLLPDGRVYNVPFNSTVASIYNPATNTFTDTPAHGKGTLAFGGGVLLPDGRVYNVPRSSTVGVIYNPTTDTFTDTPAHGKGTVAFFGGVLLPDGRVYNVPRNSAVGMITSGSWIKDVSDWQFHITTLLGPYLNKF